MTCKQTAAAMHRLADVIATLPGESLPFSSGCSLSDDQAAGAALMVVYLRDLFTAAEADQYSREKILVILETVSRDHELFPHGIGTLFWNMEDDDGPA